MSPSIERPRSNTHECGRVSEPLQAEHNATTTFLLPNRQEAGHRQSSRSGTLADGKAVKPTSSGVPPYSCGGQPP